MTSPEAAARQVAEQFKVHSGVLAGNQTDERRNSWPAVFVGSKSEGIVVPFRTDSAKGAVNQPLTIEAPKPIKSGFGFAEDAKHALLLSEVAQNTFDSVSGFKGTPPDALYRGKIKEYAQSRREAAKVFASK